MRFKNQIDKIINFIESENNNLIITNFNESVITFYKSLVIYFAKQKNVNVSNSFENISLQQTADLFMPNNEIKIYSSTNARLLDKFFYDINKKIIITDYRNFKRYKDKVDSINAYQFEQDIKYFILKILKIKSESLMSFCAQNPALTFSEVSKYLINPNYTVDTIISDQINHVVDIRKNIFSLKNKTFEIKNLYHSIKKEAYYKKFNFLIY